MACKYCLEGELSDEFIYCPKCGHRLEAVRGLRKLWDLAKQVCELNANLVRDENGKYMKLEREPVEVDVIDLNRDSLTKFDPENVDISREMIWLEAASILNNPEEEED